MSWLLPMLDTLLDPHGQRPFHRWRLHSLSFSQICFAAIDEAKKSLTFVTSTASTQSKCHPLTPLSVSRYANTLRMQLLWHPTGMIGQHSVSRYANTLCMQCAAIG
eukprot:scaffold133961_cov41-Cyclotella_meneghiniana.AAC.1